MWNPYYDTYLGQVIVRDHRHGEGPAPSGQQPLSPRVPPRDPRPQRPDPRVTTPPFPQQPQQPDPRLTTRPEHLRPRDDRHEDRDDRRLPERHPQRRHRDYVYASNRWWPRWYPYSDPYWAWYWEYLFWYYKGYENPEYAAWARDEVLRKMAPQRGWL